MQFKSLLIGSVIALAGCQTTTSSVEQNQSPAPTPAAASAQSSQSVALNRLVNLPALEAYGQLGIAAQIQEGCPRAETSAENYQKVRKRLRLGVKFGRTQGEKKAAYEAAKEQFAKKYGKPLGADMDYCAVLKREQREQTPVSAYFKPLK